MDQRQLADLSGLSVPTIQRMEASESMVRGNVVSLVKLIAAFDKAGIEMIDEGAASTGKGRGVRLTRWVESERGVQDGGSDGNALREGRKRSA
jgi:transcriptional regulator with XRE-family HTH domain